MLYLDFGVEGKEEKKEKKKKNHNKQTRTLPPSKLPQITIPLQNKGIISYILNFKYLSLAIFLGLVCHQIYHN